MKAIVRDAYGPPEVLELRDIDIPEIADDEVLVRVHAAGVGRDVWHVMTGLPYPIRLAGYGFREPNNPVIGSDVAGVVEAVGKNVSRFQPRIRKDHTGHRQDVPAEPGPRGHPVSGRRTRSRKSRHHRVRRTRKVYSPNLVEGEFSEVGSRLKEVASS